MPYRLTPSETSRDANIAQVDYVPPWFRELRDLSMDNNFGFDQGLVCWGIYLSGASQPLSQVFIDPTDLVWKKSKMHLIPLRFCHKSSTGFD